VKNLSPEDQLAGFLDKYTPEVAAFARAVRARMRARLPGAIEMVYDNYNALVIGYLPRERPSEAIFSIVVYPRWVTLFFLQGAGLPDPGKLLKGSGNIVRHIVLDEPQALDRPAIATLMEHALDRAIKPLDPKQPHRLVIKSISAKQRPRRPAASEHGSGGSSARH
jgi:hypothetical protein